MERRQQTTPNQSEEHFETETTCVREAGRREHRRRHDETTTPPATFESPPALPIKTRTGGSRRPNRRRSSGQPTQGSPAFSSLFAFLCRVLFVSCLGFLARTAAAEYPRIGRDVDAETGRKCVDEEPENCPVWAANGECEANRSYMHVNCKRSCNRCHVVRVQGAGEINSFLAQKKKEHDERKREEQREEDEVLEFLKRVGISGEESERRKREKENKVVRGDDGQSKGLPGDGGGGVAVESSGGAATAEINGNGGVVIGNGHGHSVVVTDTTSNATIENGDPSSAGGSHSKPSTTENERRTEEERKPKKKKKTTTTTRGSSGGSNEEKPKIDVETGSECVDQNKNCPYWAEKGECKANRTYMNVNCRLSCNRCHIVRVNSEREMRRYIAQKTRGRKTVTREEREERNVRKVLEGGTVTSGNERDGSHRGRDEL